MDWFAVMQQLGLGVLFISLIIFLGYAYSYNKVTRLTRDIYTFLGFFSIILMLITYISLRVYSITYIMTQSDHLYAYLIKEYPENTNELVLQLYHLATPLANTFFNIVLSTNVIRWLLIVRVYFAYKNIECVTLTFKIILIINIMFIIFLSGCEIVFICGTSKSIDIRNKMHNIFDYGELALYALYILLYLYLIIYFKRRYRKLY